MAPLRSSRSTRNQDHAAAARSRTGIVDLDPTDGLPVTKWSQISIRLNQDTDFSALNSNNTGSADWGAQFNTPQYPWPEPPLPTYFKDLPLWNQEMIRRARAGNTENKLSIWDRKTKEWISAAEAEKKKNDKTLDSSNQDQSTATNGQNGAHTSPKSNHGDDDSDSRSDDDHMQDEETTPFKTPTQTTKRRKTAGHLEPRVFEVKKWVQVPMSIAEMTAEPKFLADRRPGMPALYNPAYQNTIFGAYLSSNQIATSNYDLGDGGGLGNAAEMLEAAPAAEPEAPPVRRNMPPKRKKKKLGGPGRKKINVPTTVAGQQPQISGEAGNVTGDVLGSGMPGIAERVTGGDIVMGVADGDEASGSESEGEGEGSEEGELEGKPSEEKKNEEDDVLPIQPEEVAKVSPPRSPQLPPEITAPAVHAEQEQQQEAPVPAPELACDPVPVVEPLPESAAEVEEVPMVPSVLAEAPVALEPPVVEPLAVPEPVTVSDPGPIEPIEELAKPADPVDAIPSPPVPVQASAPDAPMATVAEAQVHATPLEQEEVQTQAQDVPEEPEVPKVPEVAEVDLLGNVNANIDQDMADR